MAFLPDIWPVIDVGEKFLFLFVSLLNGFADITSFLAECISDSSLLSLTECNLINGSDFLMRDGLASALLGGLTGEALDGTRILLLFRKSRDGLKISLLREGSRSEDFSPLSRRRRLSVKLSSLCL